MFGADRVTVAPPLDDAIRQPSAWPDRWSRAARGARHRIGRAGGRSALTPRPTLAAEEQTADEQTAVDPDDDWSAESAVDAAVVDPNLTGETVEGETLSVATAEFEDLEEPFADDVADDPFAETTTGTRTGTPNGTPTASPTSTRAVGTTGEVRPARHQTPCGSCC